MFCQLRVVTSLPLVCSLALICCSLASCPLQAQEGGSGNEQQPGAGPDPTQLSKALAAFNHGAALLGNYKYEESAERSQVAVDLFPDWLAARFNLALPI